ncbi:hypothetical protein [Oryzibacter oryziterrae]|uniref:hypothetical protein n=1 Tax=Oryzibacter oryziterrae TaxID=2766474 RepID=UPI001F36D327|nr:hypothetical protein [Oryzibacter oryziterrae]
MNFPSVLAIAAFTLLPLASAQAENLIPNGDFQQYTLQTDAIGAAYFGPSNWKITNWPRIVRNISIVRTAAGESYGVLSTLYRPGASTSAAYPANPNAYQFFNVPSAGTYKLSVDVSYTVRTYEIGQGLAIALDYKDVLKDYSPSTGYADIPVHTASTTVTFATAGSHIIQVRHLKAKTTYPVTTMTFDNIVLEKLP